MKKVVWFVQLVLFTAVIFLSSDASAACAYDGNGNCIKMVIIAGDDDEGTSGGGGLIGGGLGCGGCGGGGNINVPLFSDLIKKDKRFCIKAGESCTPGWSTRMTAGSVNPPARGVCQEFGGNASTCASAVGQESAVQDCANVSANNPC
jgi:hypothetical protein